MARLKLFGPVFGVEISWRRPLHPRKRTPSAVPLTVLQSTSSYGTRNEKRCLDALGAESEVI